MGKFKIQDSLYGDQTKLSCLAGLFPNGVKHHLGVHSQHLPLQLTKLTTCIFQSFLINTDPT